MGAVLSSVAAVCVTPPGEPASHEALSREGETATPKVRVCVRACGRARGVRSVPSVQQPTDHPPIVRRMAVLHGINALGRRATAVSDLADVVGCGRDMADDWEDRRTEQQTHFVAWLGCFVCAFVLVLGIS